jgi:hypothetical protein
MITLTKVEYLSKIFHHTLFHNPKLRVNSITPTTQIQVFAMLLVLIAGFYEVWHLGSSEHIMFNTKFH